MPHPYLSSGFQLQAELQRLKNIPYTRAGIIMAVDELGDLKAVIADLTMLEKCLKDRLAAVKPDGGHVDGNMFRVNIVRYERLVTDDVYKEKLEALVREHMTARFRREHTSKELAMQVRVTAKVRDQVAA